VETCGSQRFPLRYKGVLTFTSDSMQPLPYYFGLSLTQLCVCATSSSSHVLMLLHVCLQVGIGRDLTLFALRRGRVMISCEKLSPRPRSSLKPAVDAGEVFYKYFFHVVPIDPQPGLFRLVSQI